jgi:hypothetical protein
MLTRMAVATTILSLILPVTGFAQGFSQGDKVLSLNGVGLSNEDFDSTTFSVSGDLSYFFTSNISGAIRQTVGFSDVANGDSEWTASTRVAVDYNFDMGRWWPFVGGSIGYVYGDDIDDTWVGGPEAGVRFFVNQTTFILGMIEWEFFFDNSSEEDSEFIYVLGIGFRW